MKIIFNNNRYLLKGFTKSFNNALRDRNFTRGVKWTHLYDNIFIVTIESKGSEECEGILHDECGFSVGSLIEKALKRK